MSWDVVLAGAARKAVRKAPRGDQDRLLAAVEEMRSHPWSGDIVHLRNEPTAWRRRVGDWRILYDIDSDRHIVLVADVVRRTSTTYRRRRR
jgi:mRNA-degrading endonuclease RelE of RelBE toxin-antitoxin system